ncbi:MAG: ribosome silencing factor [Pseudomonadales bacterium]|nr:ribosome silencing factor [Pseudomonadales bacterium]
MDSETLKKLVIDALEDVKGQAIACLDVRGLTSVADYMVVVTGTSGRHLRALADEVSKKAREAGCAVIGMEGEEQAEWILLDLGDVIVHVMLAATRQLYDLEALWSLGASRAK